MPGLPDGKLYIGGRAVEALSGESFETVNPADNEVIARIELAGVCWINHYNVTPIEMAFGGAKQSGLGKENGLAAADYYSELKSVSVGLGGVEAPF